MIVRCEMDVGESRQTAVTRYCEHDNESSMFIKAGVVDRILASH